MDPLDRVQREELLRSAVLAGNENAWRTWYDETFDDLYRYVRWRCGGRKDWADEIVQDTWLTAVRRVRRFDPRKGSFLAWLRGIAANLLRNELRKRRRSPKFQQSPDGEIGETGQRRSPAGGSPPGRGGRRRARCPLGTRGGRVAGEIPRWHVGGRDRRGARRNAEGRRIAAEPCPAGVS